MEKEFFDKILDQVIEEASTMYVENEEINKEDIEKVEFSDIHKQKMKNLFKEVRKNEQRKKLVKLTKKVAVVVLSLVVLSGVLITSVEAWREEVIKFIMKNNDDNYMSIDFGNNTNEENSGDESGETENSNSFIIDDIKFMYLPEGVEFKEKKVFDYSEFYNFVNDEEFILFKKERFQENFSKEADIENAKKEKYKFEDKEVFKITKENTRESFIWYDDYNIYTVNSHLITEEEVLKFIENIKILKNF